MDFTATHRLGARAFVIFFIRHVKWPVLGMAIALVAWFWHKTLPAPYFSYLDYAVKVAFIVAAGLFVLKALRAYFEYQGYAYRFDNEFFHLSRGYIARQEIGVVYHQIQTVILRHGAIDRVVGVSHLVIVMNGTNRYQPAEVILPALEREKARQVQRELLRLARIHSPQPYSPGAGQ